MEVFLNLNNASDSLDVLKYCILYFDKVTLLQPTKINQVHMGSHDQVLFSHYISDELLSAGMYLQNEGILHISDGAIEHKLFLDGTNWKPEIFKIAEQITVNNSKLLFNVDVDAFFENGVMHIKPDARLTSNEAKEALENIVIKRDRYPFGLNLEETYNHSEVFNAIELYSALMADMLDHLGDGENVLSNSMILNTMLRTYLNPADTYQNDATGKYSALNAMKILLPYIRNASFEDILNIRHHAKDELLEMRNYVDSCVKELQVNGITSIDAEFIKERLYQKLSPAIRCFERKIESMKISSVQQFIKNIANPLYYSPLITSFFSDIPPAVLLAVSLGLIGADSIVNYKVKKNDLKSDPLYFTVALKKY